MAGGNYAPRMDPGTHRTYTATTAITAGQAVEITGDDSVGATTAATAKFAGVAQYDAAIGELVTVISNGVQRLKASGAIAAGQRVSTGAAGVVVVVSTGAAVGLCTKGAADGALADIDLNL